MKNKSYLICFLILISSMLNIKNASASSGTGVGNGRTAYWSTENRFGIQYSNELTLTVVNRDNIEISNQKLLAERDPVSKVTFKVWHERSMSNDDLKNYVTSHFPKLKFVPLSLVGAQSFASEVRTVDHLVGIYFVTTANRDLIEIKVDAYKVGRGLDLILPIVHSFTYDVTPPVIDAVRAESLHLFAGSKTKIFFHSKDENSGLDLNDFCSATLSPYSIDGKPSNFPPISSQRGSCKAEGHDWYSITMVVSQYARPGNFYLSWIELQDKAGNNGLLGSDSAFASYQRATTMKKSAATETTMIKPLRFIVTNSGASDVTPPVLREVREDLTLWKTGEPHRVYLRITDDVSGVEITSLDCLLVGEGPHLSESTCKSPRAEGNGWYSLEVTVNKYHSGGRYQLQDVRISDRAGNSTYLRNYYWDDNNEQVRDGFYHVFPSYSDSNGIGVKTRLASVAITAKNFGGIDETGPEILALEVEDPNWKTGTTARIRFRAFDFGTGISLKNEVFDDGMFRSMYFFALSDDDIFSWAPETKTFVSDGDGWYHADLQIDPFMKPGERQMMTFVVHDLAGNGSSVTCSYRQGPPHCINSNGPVIQPITINVVR